MTGRDNDDTTCPLCKSEMVGSQYLDVPGHPLSPGCVCLHSCADGVSTEIYDEAIKRRYDQTHG